MERLGLALCTGCGIGEALDTEALEKLADGVGCASTLSHAALCSPEGLAGLREAAEKENLDGLLISACSSRAKLDEFNSLDRTKYGIERVSLREQVVWSHPPNEEDSQMLAEDLVRMGAAKLEKVKLPERVNEEISRVILVVGGGVTGLEAARAAASCGHSVVLLEKKSELGGYLKGMPHIPPQGPPYDSPQPNPLPELVKQVEGLSDIRVLTSATLKGVAGQPGQFDVTVETPQGTEEIRVGAIVQATGALPYQAAKLSHLGFDEHQDVITSHDLEKMIAAKALTRPSDSKAPGRVLFVQCAGSRDTDHLSYCSSECCMTTLKQVAELHDLAPDVETAIVYRDMRTPGQMERFYLAVQEHPMTFLARGDVERVTGDGNGALAVHVKNSQLGEDVVMPADMVVLATGMIPRSADGESIRILKDARRRAETSDSDKQKAKAAKTIEEYARYDGAEILNLSYRQGSDLPVLESEFPDSHFICFPYETRRTGIYVAGTLRAPMEPARAAEDGWGAAMKAMQCVAEASRGEAVHPRAGDISIPDFFLQRCTQCKRCTEECPFGTLNEDAKGTPQLNPLRCRRCGICMGSCPERIVSFAEYSVDAVASAVKAINVPEEDEGARRRGRPAQTLELLDEDRSGALPGLLQRGLDRRRALAGHRRRDHGGLRLGGRLPVPLRAGLRARSLPPGEHPGDDGAPGSRVRADQGGRAGSRRVPPHPGSSRRVRRDDRRDRGQPVQRILRGEERQPWPKQQRSFRPPVFGKSFRASEPSPWVAATSAPPAPASASFPRRRVPFRDSRCSWRNGAWWTGSPVIPPSGSATSARTAVSAAPATRSRAMCSSRCARP
jgi:quinone-modifying oxidoreductase subunit QmoB